MNCMNPRPSSTQQRGTGERRVRSVNIWLVGAWECRRRRDVIGGPGCGWRSIQIYVVYLDWRCMGATHWHGARARPRGTARAPPAPALGPRARAGRRSARGRARAPCQSAGATAHRIPLVRILGNYNLYFRISRKRGYKGLVHRRKLF